MLNVQTLGILLRALRDGQTRPDALRAPGAVAGVARVTRVADDANESVRGDAALRTLPALRPLLSELARDERDASSEAVASDERANVSTGTLRPPARGPGAAGGFVGTMRAADVAATAPSTGANTAIALSATGRWLAGVQSRAPGIAAPVSQPNAPPLVHDADSAAPVLSRALERAVSASGLFYESHLARWIRDDMPIGSIAQEPQAAWAAPAAPDAQGGIAASLPQDADKLALVARQLEVLDTRSVAWSGVLWPGQPASIEIREDERDAQPDRAGRTAKPATVWRTRVTMTLPSLGVVEATLTLRGDAIELAFVARDGARARLAAARDALVASLAERSLALSAFTLSDSDER